MTLWFRLTGVATAWLSILAALAFLRVWMARRSGYFNINDAYFLYQDVLVLGVFIVIYLVAGAAQDRRLTGLVLKSANRAGRPFIMALALGVFVIVLSGAALVIGPIPLSGDEFFANFDARIFAHGGLVASIPPQWRPYAHALQPIYASVTPGNAGWSSVYLPVNSLIRAGFSKIGLAALAGPVLSGLAVLLVWRLARRLWPTRPDAAVVAAAFLAFSPQFLVTAMTPYAMTAGLVLGLGWLDLFWTRRVRAQIAAAVVAFAFCGLHRWLFAPMFAAPFLVLAWRDGRRTAAASGVVAFILGALFWIEWPDIRLLMLGYPASAAGWADIGDAAAVAGWVGAPLIMADNLVRFAVWQNPLTLPLALAAGKSVLARPYGAVTALAAGPLIAVAVLTVFVPFQGHGFGYRYLHFFLGSFSLLAAAAWVRLFPDGASHAQRSAVVAAVLGALLVLPMLILSTRADLARFAFLSSLVARAPADVVLVDTRSEPFAVDLVRNDPFLENRPKIVALNDLSGGQLAALTAHHSVERFSLRARQACLGPVAGVGTPMPGETCRTLPPVLWP